MQYFDLKISPTGIPNEYTVRVPGGPNAVPAPTEETIQFSKDSIAQDIVELQRRDGLLDLNQYDRRCRSVGFLLFQTFFPGEIGKRYLEYDKAMRDLEGDQTFPRIRIFVPDGLHGCPWELLRTELELEATAGEDLQLFIARRGLIIRYPNGNGMRFRSLTGTLKPPLRLLYIFSSPQRYPRLDLLELPRNKNVMELPKKPGRTLRTFRENIGSAKGFLFHGHAELKPDGGVELVFETGERAPDPVPAWQIGADTQNYGTELVLLSACRTAAFSENNFRKSTVGTLLFDGYPALIIAYQTEINDLAGGAFVRGFIHDLYGQSLIRAVKAGRNAIGALQSFGKNGPDIEKDRAARDWWVPVLYSSTLNPEPVFQSPDSALERLGSI